MSMRSRVSSGLLGFVVGDALGSPYAGFSSLPSLLGSHAQSVEVNERLRQHAEPSALTGALMISMESLVQQEQNSWEMDFFNRVVAFGTQCGGHLVQGTNLGFAGRIRRLVDRWKSDSFVEHGQREMDDVSVFGDALPFAILFGSMVRDQTNHVARDIVALSDILCVDAESVSAIAYAAGIIRATIMEVPWGHEDATELGREVAYAAIHEMKISKRLERLPASISRAEGALAIAHARLCGTGRWRELMLPEEIDARDAPQQLLLNALSYASADREHALNAVGNLPRKGADVDILLPLVCGLLGCRFGREVYSPLESLIAPVEDYADRIEAFLTRTQVPLSYIGLRKTVYQSRQQAI